MTSNQEKLISQDDFISSCIQEMSKAEVYLPFTISSRLKREAIEKLEIIKGEILKAKYDAINREEEKLANLMLALQCGVNSFISELNCILSLKEGIFRRAWDFLVDAQEYTVWSYRAAPYNKMLLSRYEDLLLLEKAYFPKMVYLSMGATVSNGKCSICGSLIDECDHLEGLPYMGRICQIVDYNVVNVNHIAMVDEPRDKRCILLSFSDEKKENMIDRFTKEPIGKIKPEDRLKQGLLTEGIMLRFAETLEIF
ncbi:MAG: hypothetical protein MH252_05445 [Thermosynechococcaceae cyanobacterium MS004]|nr:hypothetical protein [Thermosynechococcaceae cyanobacterium MS004]